MSLQPIGALNAAIYGVYGGQQAGSADFGSGSQAILWSGSSTGWVTLSSNAGAGGIWGSQCVGYVGGTATLWDHGVAVSLNPSGATYSVAIGVRDGQQVGFANLPIERAILWHGTAASAVNLHPAGAISSFAYATDGTLQGGSATFGGTGTYHAATWNGSAATFQDLNPSSAYISEILGMAPGQQVGYAQLIGGQEHAALWSGTAQSFQDFEPTSLPNLSSRLLATTGTEQVGDISVGLPRATIWFGSRDNYLDLQQFLPGNFTSSEATSAYRDGSTLYVGGWGQISGQTQAFLWVGTVPAPGSVLVLLGAAGIAIRRRQRCDQRRPLTAVCTRDT